MSKIASRKANAEEVPQHIISSNDLSSRILAVDSRNSDITNDSLNVGASTSSSASSNNIVRSSAQRSASDILFIGGAALKRVNSKLAIVVSCRQRGNPILQHIKNVPWEYGEIVPDYLLGAGTCALFLSLKYHNLNPEYIYDRLKGLGKAYVLRILLVLIDVQDPHHPLKELAKMAIMADVTLLPAWSCEEAGKYLEMYKSFENKPADMIKAHIEGDYFSAFTEALTTVRSVNKTDARTASANYKSFDKLTKATREDLSLLPGFGVQKAKRLHDVLHQPFLCERNFRSQDAGSQDVPET